ncbi:unnamed protein product [Moneuplotes crassus]|uniref:Uncharacterized protein n=1 Tax=Euplotes crassus TaxID=5936 RepID=A0AAD1TZB3_EUPCR|nr:unnamed protein product [Moneuplotes crassus]
MNDNLNHREIGNIKLKKSNRRQHSGQFTFRKKIFTKTSVPNLKSGLEKEAKMSTIPLIKRKMEEGYRTFTKKDSCTSETHRMVQVGTPRYEFSNQVIQNYLKTPKNVNGSNQILCKNAQKTSHMIKRDLVHHKNFSGYPPPTAPACRKSKSCSTLHDEDIEDQFIREKIGHLSKNPPEFQKPVVKTKINTIFNGDTFNDDEILREKSIRSPRDIKNLKSAMGIREKPVKVKKSKGLLAAYLSNKHFIQKEFDRLSADHKLILADFEYPQDLNDLKKYMIHLDPSICEKINYINKDVHSIVGFNMFRLLNGGKDYEKFIENEHSLTCCGETYTLQLYLEERYLVKEFNSCFERIYKQFIEPLKPHSTKRIDNAMLLFSYISAELRNQLKLKCAEKGQIIDNLIILYYETLTSVIKVLEYKIKHHDVIQELTEDLKKKNKIVNSLQKENESLRKECEEKENSYEVLRNHRDKIRIEKKILNSKLIGMKAIVNKTLKVNYSALFQFGNEHASQLSDIVNSYKIFSQFEVKDSSDPEEFDRIYSNIKDTLDLHSESEFDPDYKLIEGLIEEVECRLKEVENSGSPKKSMNSKQKLELNKDLDPITKYIETEEDKERYQRILRTKTFDFTPTTTDQEIQCEFNVKSPFIPLVDKKNLSTFSPTQKISKKKRNLARPKNSTKNVTRNRGVDINHSKNMKFTKEDPIYMSESCSMNSSFYQDSNEDEPYIQGIDAAEGRVSESAVLDTPSETKQIIQSPEPPKTNKNISFSDNFQIEYLKSESLNSLKKLPIDPEIQIEQVSDFDAFNGNSLIIEELPDQEHTDSEVDQKCSESNEEELRYKVPIKLMIAAKNLSNKIRKLPKDEYGDVYYDCKDPSDKWSQKLKKAGEIMMFWVKKLFNANDEKEMNEVTKEMKKHTITYDKEIQVSTLIKKDKLKIDLRPASKEARKRRDTDKFSECGSQIRSGSSTIRSKGNQKYYFLKSGRKSMFFPSKDLTSPLNPPQVTETVPFKFQMIPQKQMKSYNSDLPKYILTFKKSYLGNKKKMIKNVRAIPLKLFIKNIFGFYNEKSLCAKNSASIKYQSLSDFLYDTTYNKYGIVKLTEKKLKELLLTTALNYKKHPEVELFGHFIGILDKYYTNDDLTFYYKLEKIFSNMKFEKEGAHLTALEIHFREKLSQQQLEDFIGRVQRDINSSPNAQKKSKNKYWFINKFIRHYRKLKMVVAKELSEILTLQDISPCSIKTKESNESEKIMLQELTVESFKKIITQLDTTHILSEGQIDHIASNFTNVKITAENAVSIIIDKGLWNNQRNQGTESKPEEP